MNRHHCEKENCTCLRMNGIEEDRVSERVESSEKQAVKATRDVKPRAIVKKKQSHRCKGRRIGERRCNYRKTAMEVNHAPVPSGGQSPLSLASPCSGRHSTTTFRERIRAVKSVAASRRTLSTRNSQRRSGHFPGQST